MSFHFHPKSEWSLLNEKAAELLGVKDEKQSVRVYDNSAHALLELALGYFQQFPLKKKFYYLKDADPHFELVVTALSKQGLQAQALNFVQLEQPDEIVAQIDRETGVFILPFENPISGAPYNVQALDAKLAEKSVFRLTTHYSPSTFSSITSQVDRTSLRILQMPVTVARGAALAVLGERGRFGSLTSDAIEVRSLDDFDAGFTPALGAAAGAVCKYRDWGGAAGQIPTGAHSLGFTQTDLDGHALIHFLAEADGQPLASPGHDPRFETASLTRWGGLKTMDWFKASDLSIEQIRGSVFLFADYVNRHSPQELHKKIEAARAQVLAKQSGHKSPQPS